MIDCKQMENSLNYKTLINNMKKKNYFFVLVFLFALLLLSINFVEAKDPKLSIANGLEIRQPVLPTIAPGETIELAFHIDSKETGLALTSTDIFFCDLHLYDPSNSHIWVTRKTNADLEHDYDIEFLPGINNFTIEGDYWYNIYCECDNCAIAEGFEDLGGWARETIILKEEAVEEIETAEALIYFILAFGVLILFALSFYFMIATEYGNEVNEKGAVIKITKLKYVKLALILLTWVLFTWFLNILIGLSDNFVSLTMYYGFFGFMFTIMNAVALPLGVVIIVIMLFEIVRDANIMENIKKFGSSYK